jgi:hypothetical protein
MTSIFNQLCHHSTKSKLRVYKLAPLLLCKTKNVFLHHHPAKQNSKDLGCPFSYLKIKKNLFLTITLPNKIQKISDAYSSALLWDVLWKLVI